MAIGLAACEDCKRPPPGGELFLSFENLCYGKGDLATDQLLEAAVDDVRIVVQ